MPLLLYFPLRKCWWLPGVSSKLGKQLPSSCISSLGEHFLSSFVLYIFLCRRISFRVDFIDGSLSLWFRCYSRKISQAIAIVSGINTGVLVFSFGTPKPWGNLLYLMSEIFWALWSWISEKTPWPSHDFSHKIFLANLEFLDYWALQMVHGKDWGGSKEIRSVVLRRDICWTLKLTSMYTTVQLFRVQFIWKFHPSAANP